MKVLVTVLALSCSVSAMYPEDEQVDRETRLPLTEIQTGNHGFQYENISKVEFVFHVEGIRDSFFCVSQSGEKIYNNDLGSSIFTFHLPYDYNGPLNGLSFELNGENSVHENKSIIEKAFGKKVTLEVLIFEE